jgi:tetratricopeptide (TPR) repeat protein
MVFCQSLGIHTKGVITKDHAFITIPADGTDIDVETTNAYGFDPGNRKEFHDQFGKVTGFSYVPARNSRDRQTISRIELVSLILNNRIAGHERQNQFADSVPLAVDRASLLTGGAFAGSALAGGAQAAGSKSQGTIFTDPRKDLMDRLFNFGAMLIREGKEEESLRWAAAASPVYPDEKRWQDFIMTAANNRLAKLIRANKYSDARKFIDSQRQILSEADFNKLDALLIDSELSDGANKIRTAADGDNVINAAEQARNNGKISEKRAVELITFAVQKTASSLGAAPAGNLRTAIQYIEAALSRFGANRELEQFLNLYRGNLAADFHNRFTAAWNKKDYPEAERILNEGLTEFPDNRRLLADKQTVDRYNR